MSQFLLMRFACVNLQKNSREVRRATEETLQKKFSRDTEHIRNNGGVTYIK
jgi:hypothetical protein